MDLIKNMFRGSCMAFADSVPGISGGTIAFILGFYDKFINSLNDIISGNLSQKKQAIFFLLKLLLGWVIGFSISVVILGNIFNSHIYQLCSLFIGFSIFAIPLIVKEENKSIKGNYKNIVFTFIGIGIVSLITYFNSVSVDSAINISNMGIGIGIYIFISAMVAISAMVVPGISGSTILLILGLYIPIINSIKEILSFNFAVVPQLIIFGLGILTGIVTVIKFIKNALEKRRSEIIYLIIGLMIGSVYAIIMGPTTLDVPKPAMDINSFSVIWFIVGGLILYLIDFTKRKML